MPVDFWNSSVNPITGFFEPAFEKHEAQNARLDRINRKKRWEKIIRNES